VIRESKDIKGAVESLRTLITSRWNPEAGLLNLENMALDPVFATSKLKPPIEKGAPRHASAALWKVASELCPGIQSLSLANNKLSTLVDLAPSALIRYLPTLKNLSLQNNALSQYADLNPLSTVVGTITGSKPGLGELQELILTGNPLTDREMSKSAVDYHAEVRRRFPSLKMLDQVVVDQTIPIPAPKATASTSKGPGIEIAGKAKRTLEQSRQGSGHRTKAQLPLTMQGPFADSDTSRNAMSQFLVKFFHSMDQDRAQLAFAYTAQATLSLSVNTTVSERARRTQHLTSEAISKQKELSWATYLGSAYEKDTHNGKSQENLSRNFLRNKNAQRREETLHVGPEKIGQLLAKLPATSHPLSDANKFVVDTWQQPGTGEAYPELLVVVVHGEFAEHPSMASRSFDRTLVLAPAAPATPAANAGWPCVIISDLLVLRNWTNPEVWKPEAPAAVPGTSQAAAAAPAAGQPELTHAQRAMMNDLHTQTRLNAQFCFQCLSETGWNLQAALQAFEAAKASIPPEAYM